MYNSSRQKHIQVIKTFVLNISLIQILNLEGVWMLRNKSPFFHMIYASYYICSKTNTKTSIGIWRGRECIEIIALFSIYGSYVHEYYNYLTFLKSLCQSVLSLLLRIITKKYQHSQPEKYIYIYNKTQSNCQQYLKKRCNLIE